MTLRFKAVDLVFGVDGAVAAYVINDGRKMNNPKKAIAIE